MPSNFQETSILTLMLFNPAVLARWLGSTPIPIRQSDDVIPLTKDQVNAFTPYSYFAAAAYCSGDHIMNWSCGPNCDANPDFLPLAQGGDPPGGIPAWYVGYSGAQNTIIVAHQGTHTEYILEDLTDVDIVLKPLDQSLFLEVPSPVLVHSGFADAQANQAKEIRTAIVSAMLDYPTQSVTIVGHSLGGAVALLDALYFALNLPSGLQLRTITYGMPRVGNPAFASFVDSRVSLYHINNNRDPVPTLPLQDFLGLDYASPNGEIHIVNNDTWELCPGHDNPSVDCIVGAVPDLLAGDETDHNGPYNGVELGSKGCSSAAPVPTPH